MSKSLIGVHVKNFFRRFSQYYVPEGYALRSVTAVYSIKLVPYRGNKQLSDGMFVDIFGYGRCIRDMAKICRMHNRHRIDEK